MRHPIFIITLIVIVAYFAKNIISSLYQQYFPPPDPNELVTLSMPSKISDNVLVITLPRCAFDDTKVYPNSDINNISLDYDSIVYSGNLKNVFNCRTPKEKELGSTLDKIVPIYPLVGTQEKFSGWAYFDADNRNEKSPIRAENRYAKLLTNGVNDILQLSNMPNQTHPVRIWLYRDNAEDAREHRVSPLSYLFEVETVIHDEFILRYHFFILVPKNRHGYNLPDYNTQFAEDYRTVNSFGGNILEYPDILQGFVDNNERVVKFYNAHSILLKIQK